MRRSRERIRNIPDGPVSVKDFSRVFFPHRTADNHCGCKEDEVFYEVLSFWCWNEESFFEADIREKQERE